MSIEVLPGEVKEYTAPENMLVISVQYGDKVEWQTDVSQDVWVPLNHMGEIRVASGIILYFRIKGNSIVKLAEVPERT